MFAGVISHRCGGYGRLHYRLPKLLYRSYPGIITLPIYQTSRHVRKYCSLTDAATNMLGLSVRARDRIIKVVRPVADMAGQEVIDTDQVAEAIGYRSLGRQLWK